MIAYDYDFNTILAYPLKSKSLADHLEAVKLIHAFLSSKMIHPKLYILDDEIS